MSICTQKEFLIESKLNGFWGVLLLLLELAVPLLLWSLLTGDLYLLKKIIVKSPRKRQKIVNCDKKSAWANCRLLVSYNSLKFLSC